MSRRNAELASLQAALDAGEPVPAERVRTLLKAQAALEHRLEKISHISDGYQARLLDLNHELTATNHQLAQAMAEVKTLRGFIPICAKCKRVRDDQGYWDSVETYISRRSEAVFTHGVCPQCAADMLRELSRLAPSPRRRRRETPADGKARLDELLASPEYQGHPLREELEELARQHERLLKRFDKIARISDGFQAQLKTLNQALAEASLTDALTGLPNRRSMMERLASESARAEREHAPLAVIMADVDHFKEINDTFGHEAGDQALQNLAGGLRAALRGSDTCARWGGEEFLFLLPVADAAAAIAVAQRVRQHLEASPLLWAGQPLPLTLSFGVAARRPGESLTALLGRVDAALYRAKQQGRNRTEVAPEP